MVALTNRAVHHTEVADNTTIGVEHRVENQSLQGCILVALRGRHTVNNGIQNLLDANTRASRSAQYLALIATEQLHNLVLHLVNHSRLHINLVDYGNDFEVVFEGKVKVGNGLCLNTLRSVNHQQRALTRSNGSRHLIGEVNVSGSVNEVERIGLTIPYILHLDSVALDGDTLLTFEVHIIKHLILQFPLGKGCSLFEESVGQSTLTVVDVGDYTKVANVFHLLSTEISYKGSLFLRSCKTTSPTPTKSGKIAAELWKFQHKFVYL